MKISVILPCYNGAETIALQLDALANQGYSGDWEVIVVNNGSTDHSMEIVESYRDRLPNLRIVEAYTPPSPRLGVSHSYNVGLKAATGDGFVFCEADDEVAPNWLAAMHNALQQQQFVAGTLEHTRLNESWLVEEDQYAQSVELPRVTHAPYLPYGFGCNLGFQRSMYQAIGEIDESFACAWDMDYCFRAQLAGIPLHFDPAIVVHYRLRHSLQAIYRQKLRWGEDYPLLRKRYGVGVGRLELPKRMIRCVLIVLQLPLILRQPKQLASRISDLGWQIGEIRGVMKHYVLPYIQGFRKVPATPLNGFKTEKR